MYKTKLRIILIVLSLILIFIFQYIFVSKQIIFSHKSGFYEEEFYLTIKKDKKSKIFYTLDNTEPTINSTQYKEPILIKDVSKNKNIYSSRADMTFKFFYEKNFLKIPTTPVDKATIIKVAKYDNNNKLIKKDYRIFFVNFENKKGYKDLPIVSVTMDPKDILDEDRGIFVLGKDKDIEEYSCYQCRNKKINFCSRDDNWMRNATIDIFDSQHKKLILSEKTKVKIKGSESRQWTQKSLSFYTIEEETGSCYFDQNPFRENIKINNIVLFNGGDDIYVKLREFLVQTVEDKTNPYIIAVKMLPCIVFLNGEYWGVYYLSENCNKQYLSDRFNIKKTNIIIEKDVVIPNEYPKEVVEIFQFFNKKLKINTEPPLATIFQNKDLSSEKDYNNICEKIDINSFVNYFATEIYIANTDWPEHNWALWKTTNKDKGCKFSDGKWRYILFDVNDLRALSDYKFDSVRKAINYSPIFKALITNKDFRDKFRKRINYLETEVYTPEKMNVFIDEWIFLMQEPIYKSNDRFVYKNSYDLFNKKINEIRLFFELRPQYINEYIDKHLGKD